MNDENGARACNLASTAISLYVDGTLELRTQRAVRAHIRECASCAALASDLRSLRHAAAALVRDARTHGGRRGVLVGRQLHHHLLDAHAELVATVESLGAEQHAAR